MSDVMHTANRIWVCASCIGTECFFCFFLESLSFHVVAHQFVHLTFRVCASYIYRTELKVLPGSSVLYVGPSEPLQFKYLTLSAMETYRGMKYSFIHFFNPTINRIFGRLLILAVVLLGNKPYTHGVRDCTVSRDDVASCIFYF